MCGAGRLIKQGKGWPAKWKERWFEFDAAGDRLLYFDMAQGKKQEAEHADLHDLFVLLLFSLCSGYALMNTQ